MQAIKDLQMQSACRDSTLQLRPTANAWGAPDEEEGALGILSSESTDLGHDLAPQGLLIAKSRATEAAVVFFVPYKPNPSWPCTWNWARHFPRERESGQWMDERGYPPWLRLTYL